MLEVDTEEMARASRTRGRRARTQEEIEAELTVFTPADDGQTVMTPTRWRDEGGRALFTAFWMGTRHDKDGETFGLCAQVFITDPASYAADQIDRGRTVVTRLLEVGGGA